MKKFIFLLFFYLPLILFGQAVIKEIKETNPNQKSDKYLFPGVTVPGNKTASNKINDELLSDFLQIKQKEVKKSIFENVWVTKHNSVQVLYDVSYSVLSNTKKLLSISISAEGCGAYCEYFTMYYSFDLGTGKRIILDSLFSQQGARVLSDSLTKGKKRILEDALKGITDTLNHHATWSNIDEKEHYEGAKELYEQCLSGLDHISLEYLRYYLVKDKLFIIAERCSAHMNRALDDIGDFTFSFGLKNWKKYLSAYAIKLIPL